MSVMGNLYHSFREAVNATKPSSSIENNSIVVG
jgi:hypothetical protein